MEERQGDRAVVGALHTIATKTWDEPTGQDRDDRLTELAAEAAGRKDLLIEAAGVLLGTRPEDKHDPRHQRNEYGAMLLLELAGVRSSDKAVRVWASIGEVRRDRARGSFQTGGLA